MTIESVEVNNRSLNITLARKLIIEWGKENFRPFPWRLTRDPYKILLSEIMLHRTQSRQVVPIYQSFVQRYTDVNSLAQATREDLNSTLYSLGLRWRIDLISEMAIELMSRFGGEIPQGKNELLTLPGLSEYIAGAVRCFAWNLPEPIFDTNTVRIAGRLFGLEIKDSSRRNPVFKSLITRLLDPDEPRAYNYAQLDLADKTCTRKRLPDCFNCPLLRCCCYGNGVTNQKRQG